MVHKGCQVCSNIEVLVAACLSHTNCVLVTAIKAEIPFFFFFCDCKPLLGLPLPQKSFPIEGKATSVSNFHHQHSTTLISASCLNSKTTSRHYTRSRFEVPTNLNNATLHAGKNSKPQHHRFHHNIGQWLASLLQAVKPKLDAYFVVVVALFLITRWRCRWRTGAVEGGILLATFQS